MPEENETNDAGKEPVEKVETPAEQQPTQPSAMDDLRSFMDSHNLGSPDDFADFVQDLGTTEQWKQKYGNSQNEVGELRRKVDELSNALNQAQYQQQQYYDPNQTYQQPTPPSLTREDVAETIQSVLGQMQQQQYETQMKYMTERNDIMRRPGWKDVQPHFDKALMDPQVQFALQNGKLTQDRLYNSINERVLMSKVNAAIQTIPQGATQQAPPAVETTDQVQQPQPEQLKKAQAIKKGIENADPDAVAKALIPDNDPMFNL